MKQNLLLFIFLSGIMLFSGGCSYHNYTRGNTYYDMLGYEKAIKFYGKALKKESFPDALVKLGHCYRLTNNSKKAEFFYYKAIQGGEMDVSIKNYYAQALMENGKYDEAKRWFENYLLQVPNDTSVQAYFDSFSSLAKFREDTFLVDIEKLPAVVNDKNSNFSPAFYRNGIVYSSIQAERGLEREDLWTGNAYLNLFFSQQDESGEWSEPEKLKGELGGPFHEGPAVFNDNGRKVYFTRSNYYHKRRGKDEFSVNHLKIYSAEPVLGKWANVEPLNFCSDNYSVGHPALGVDERTMFFISDMPGGYGGTDLYSARYDGNYWTDIKNLGPKFNTAGDEKFPYVAKDGSLYFSSDGHPGMGGLDLFGAWWNGKSWDAPENLGHPFCSSQDDFGLIMKPDNMHGFLSSNRVDEKRDEIYSFVRRPPVYRLEGLVVNKKSHLPVRNTEVVLRDAYRKEVGLAKSDGNGEFKFDLVGDMGYVLSCNSKNYFGGNVKFQTKGARGVKVYTVKLELDSIVVGRTYVLENIYYDYDKWNIRPDAALVLDSILGVLVENPGITIELSSHTDVRGSNPYNMKLSQKRAKSAKDYLVGEGIDKKRIIAKGYGETKLINRCVDESIDCPDWEHEENRRTEFTILSSK